MGAWGAGAFNDTAMDWVGELIRHRMRPRSPRHSMQSTRSIRAITSTQLRRSVRSLLRRPWRLRSARP